MANDMFERWRKILERARAKEMVTSMFSDRPFKAPNPSRTDEVVKWMGEHLEKIKAKKPASKMFEVKEKKSKMFEAV
jgi:hypothetical protein